MTNAAEPESAAPVARHDAVIVGAGSAGLYQLHRLLKLGLDVTLLEAGSGVGGVWYWNRYPGARLDSESYTYGYFFDEDLLRDWTWSEEFVGQPELERYYNFVADKLGLRPHIQLDTRVAGARFDTQAREWLVTLADGRCVACRLLITALGVLSAPYVPAIPGRESFAGPVVHTGLWPAGGVDLAGKRVAVIGTGSSGVQVITAIADEVAQLHVFQRTPNWCLPLHNRPITPEQAAEIRDRLPAIYQTLLDAPNGYIHGETTEPGMAFTPEERRRFFDRLWQGAGLRFYTANYSDILTSRETNESLNAYLAERLRARVPDPALADKLIPRDHGFGMRRPPLDSGYFEALSRPNVHLIDTSEDPIERFSERGIVTRSGEVDVDAIILATGFDALTGALERVDIRGTHGLSLRDYWREGARTHLGLFCHGFPNLVMINGPQGPTGNNPRASEVQVGFVTACIEHMLRTGSSRIETTEAAEIAWTERVNRATDGTLFAESKSWLLGANIPGKTRGPLQFIEGLRVYRAHVAQIADGGFEGLTFD